MDSLYLVSREEFSSFFNQLKEEYIDDITEEVLQIIYNGQDATDRIRQINNKLSIDTEEYSIYINNKVFNH